MDEPSNPSEPEAAEAPAPRGPDVIKAFLTRLPAGPGVYRMLDDKGDVLYVGKAKNLKARVSAYAKPAGHTQRIGMVIAQTADMEFVRTGSETEALLLEANLIKRLRPRYNIILRDDKSFAEILVRADHGFPQILKHRGAHATKGRYFGPFASAGAVSRALNTLQRAFLLRSCSDSVFVNRTRPCLLYQIKRCSAPCVGYIDEAAYSRLVADATAFLEGNDETVKAGLNERMAQAAQALDYESAANYRDRIRALAHLGLHQGINPETVKEADVVAIYSDGGQSCVQVFFFRAGQNWGNRAYFPRHDKSETPEAILDAFLAQFYDNKSPPKQILLSHEAPSRELLAEALTIRAERKVEVLVPQRGEKRALVEHALGNAKDALARRFAESASQVKLLAALAETFDLPEPPRRIEVYDNSHIMGTNAVGALIVAGADGFEKGQYRKFNIKFAETVPGDDYGMMREVLKRRFTRLLKAEDGDAKDAQRPDLVLLDGGAGQLSSAIEVMTELGIDDIALVAIAKGPNRNSGAETFFMPGQAPRKLEPGSPVLYYLERLRDEAHRFAIGTHRARRGKAISETSLDDISGIGAARKRALLAHFGSAKGVERAGLADLEAVPGVPGVSKAIAKRIHDSITGENDEARRRSVTHSRGLCRADARRVRARGPVATCSRAHASADLAGRCSRCRGGHARTGVLRVRVETGRGQTLDLHINVAQPTMTLYLPKSGNTGRRHACFPRWRLSGPRDRSRRNRDLRLAGLEGHRLRAPQIPCAELGPPTMTTPAIATRTRSRRRRCRMRSARWASCACTPRNGASIRTRSASSDSPPADIWSPTSARTGRSAPTSPLMPRTKRAAARTSWSRPIRGTCWSTRRKSSSLNPRVPVTGKEPPTFIVQAVDDPVDPVEDSLVYYIALKKGRRAGRDAPLRDRRPCLRLAADGSARHTLARTRRRLARQHRHDPAAEPLNFRKMSAHEPSDPSPPPFTGEVDAKRPEGALAAPKAPSAPAVADATIRPMAAPPPGHLSRERGRRSWTAHLPNALSVLRAALAIPICFLIADGSPTAIWFALTLFAVARATDFIDGKLARALDAASVLGSHLDPLADKILVGAPLATVVLTQEDSVAVTALALFVVREGLVLSWRLQHLRPRSGPGRHTPGKTEDRHSDGGHGVADLGISALPLASKSSAHWRRRNCWHSPC